MRDKTRNLLCLGLLLLLIIGYVVGLAIFATNTGTSSPTAFPTVLPTRAPTARPTRIPTVLPTAVPTAVPTDAPTAVVTDAPTALPTDTPTAMPTDAPIAVPTDAPTAVPTDAPTQAPTDIVTQPPTPVPTGAPTTPLSNECMCDVGSLPIYDNFPHPRHTDESYAVMNFYNDAAGGVNTTVWITVYFTGSPEMVAGDNRYTVGYSYVYLDAQPLSKGQFFQLTINKLNTASGLLTNGRARIYYRNPNEFDVARNATPYNGHFPVQIPGDAPVRIQTTPGNLPLEPSNMYSQLIEMTYAFVPGDDPNTQTFVDYDISAVDHIALPVYMYGGYDTSDRISLSDPRNNVCNKTYIGCATSALVVKGCPTQLFDVTSDGESCYNSFNYCELPEARRLNQSHWDIYCHAFDDYANGFGITQALLNLFNQCALTLNTSSPCPSILPPTVSTPTNVIYGSVGQFLLENHCLGVVEAATRSRLTGAQSAAINRGVCPQPDYYHIPVPAGLSCAEFNCQGNVGPNCTVFCDNYTTCFGYTCANYAPFDGLQDQTCGTTQCNITGDNCYNITRAIPTAPEVLTCDSTNTSVYLPGTRQNAYAGWARTKGEFFYTFSLDEGLNGGNRQCRDSTQLDIVIFPRCNGTFPGLKRSNTD